MLAGKSLQAIKINGSYEAFNQYELVELLIDAIPANHVIEAKHKVTGEAYFLALRHGEYSAQLDKAVSDIYRKYVPSTPQTHIVLDGNNFYIASKAIDGLVGYECIPEVMANFTPYYFGSNSVLSHFVGASDIHQGNLLISSNSDNTFYSHAIDHPESLDDDNLQNVRLKSKDESDEESSGSKENVEPEFKAHELGLTDFRPLPEPGSFSVEDIFANHWNLPASIVNHYQYKKEQAATLNAIANAPFSELATTLRNTVTASKRVEHLSFLEKLLQHDMITSKTVRKKIKAQLANPDTFAKVSEIEDSIRLLEKRHQQYAALKTNL